MKKKFVFCKKVHHFISPKIIKIMRNILILMLITVFQVFAEDSYSQKTRLTLDLNDVTVESVLNAIENQSEFYFLCNKKLVDVNRRVDVHIKGKNIDNILSRVFNGTDVDYVILDRQIVLSPSNYLRNLIKMNKFIQEGKTITGTVTDSEGVSIPGATIVVKGTTKGTTTDADGNYILYVRL